jgi:hypothetical protein
LTIALASDPTPSVRGFSAADLALLNEVRSAGLARNRWTRAQIITDSFVDYLAAWDPQSDETDPPTLAIARFKRTGTYVLTVGTLVVATARTLGDVLPALPGLLQKSDEQTETSLV